MLTIDVRAVVKIGTSSITNALGELDDGALAQALRRAGRGPRAPATRCTLVCSGAIAAGMPALGITKRPDRHRDAAGDRRRGPAAC